MAVSRLGGHTPRLWMWLKKRRHSEPPDLTAPTLVSASHTDDELTVVLSEAVVAHTGFTLVLLAGNPTLTYVSGDGTDTLLFSLSRTVYSHETGTLAYTPGDVEDAAGNDLEAFIGAAVTNGSIVLYVESLDDLTFWFDPEAGRFQTSGGVEAGAAADPIGEWQDQSGEGAHVGALTTARPTVALAAQNGRPGVRFDGVGQRLKRTPYTALFGAVAFTWSAVFRVDTTSPAQMLVEFGAEQFGVMVSGGLIYLFIGGAQTGSFAFDSTGAHQLTVVYDGTQTGNANRLKVWLNGSQRLLVFAGTIPASLGAAGVSEILTVGSRYNDSMYVDGDEFEQALYAAPYPGAERLTLESYLRSRWATRPQTILAADGDSLTAGAGSTGGNTYPAQMLPLLTGGAQYYDPANYGVGGQTVVQMASDAAAQIDPTLQPTLRNVLLAWGGTNDLAGGANAATTYANLVSYCQARRAAGWQVVVATILPRDAAAPFEADRQTVNTSIRTNWATFADALADVAADARIGDVGDNADTTYYDPDAIHMNNAGYGVVAGIFATAVNGLA